MFKFFRNALIYRLTQSLDWNNLQAALESKPHREPASQEMSTYGFIPPFNLGDQSPLVQTVAGQRVYQLIAAKKTERILPGSVVRDALKQKIDEIEKSQMRKVYKKEKDQLKDEIVQAFLPRSFLKHKTTFALLLDDMIIVDASSARQAEDLLSTLREALGSLPARPLAVKLAPSATFTDWMKRQQASNGLHLLDECELRDTHEDGGIVKCKRQDLGSDEVQEHLAAGKLVTKLSLAYSDKLSFLIDDKLAIKRIRFEDLLQEQAEQDGGDDAASVAVASLAIMAGTFAEFIPSLLEALGGEDIPQGI